MLLTQRVASWCDRISYYLLLLTVLVVPLLVDTRLVQGHVIPKEYTLAFLTAVNLLMVALRILISKKIAWRY